MLLMAIAKHAADPPAQPHLPDFIPAEFIGSVSGLVAILGFIIVLLVRWRKAPQGLGWGAGAGGILAIVIWLAPLLAKIV